MALIIGGAGLGQFDVQGQARVGGAGEIAVNAFTGNVVAGGADQRLITQGLDLSLARTYNSQGASGEAWRFSFERRIVSAGEVLERVSGDGHRSVFRLQDDGTYLSTSGSGAHDVLLRDGETWIYTEGTTGLREVYRVGDGQLQYTEDSDSNRVTYGYENGVLTSLVGAGGETLSVVYDDAGRVSRLDTYVVGADGDLTHSHSKVHYGYDDAGRLSSVTVDLTPADKSIEDGHVFTTTYTYQGTSSLIESVTQSNGSVVTLSYQDVEGQTRLSTINDNGQVTAFDWDMARANGHQLAVTDAGGAVRYYQHDAQGRLTSVLSPDVVYGDSPGAEAAAVQGSMTYTYDDADNLETVTDASGAVVRNTYDDNGNLTGVYRNGVLTLSHTYDANNQRVSSTRYYEDGTVEGISHAVYDGWLLRFTVSATGSVTEHTYNSVGERVSTRVYTGAAFDTASTVDLSALTGWTASQSKQHSILTDYTYARGEVATQTTYTQLDDAGQGIVVLDITVSSSVETAGRSMTVGTTPVVSDLGTGITLTVLDAQHRIISIDTVDTQNEAAGGRLLAEALAALVMPENGGKVVVIGSEGWANNISGKAATALKALGLNHPLFTGKVEERRASDTLLVAVSEVKDGQWSLVDQSVRAADGAQTLSVTGTEHVQMTYDAFGNLLGTQTLSGNLTTGDVRVLSQTSQVVDGLNRVISTTDAAGNTVSTQYLDASRQVLVTQESGLVTERTFSARGELVTETQRATGEESRTRGFVYDARGQLVATTYPNGSVSVQQYDSAGRLWVSVSVTGQVTEYRRDSEGRVVQEIRYDSALDMSTWLNGGQDALTVTAESILSQVSEKPTHRIITTEYDARGRVHRVIDGEGRVAETVYDHQDRQTQTLTYTQGDRANAVSVTRTYDEAGRLVSQTDAGGFITRHAYDAAGRLSDTRTYHVANAAETSGLVDRVQTFYDAKGRQQYTVNAQGFLTETRYLDGGREVATYRYLSVVKNRDGGIASLLGQAGTAQLLSRVRHDSTGRLISSINQYGIETRYAYDDTTGLLRQQTVAVNTEDSRSVYHTYTGFHERHGQVTLAGKQEWQSLALTALTQQQGSVRTYNVMGWTETDTHPATGTTTYAYDNTGRLLSTTDAEGSTTSSTYNAFGETHTRTAGGELKETFTYDNAGRLSRTVDVEGITTAYHYNHQGHVSHTVRQHVSDAYQAFNTREGEARGDLIARYVTQYGYDARGNVITQSVAKDYREGSTITGGDRLTDIAPSARLKYVAQWTRKYDHAGRIISSTDGEGRETQTRYIASGRHVETRLSGALRERIELDAFGRTLAHKDAKGLFTYYTYDDHLSTLSVLTPGGVRTSTEKNAFGETLTVTDGEGNQRHFHYDHRGQVTRTEFTAAGSDTAETLTTNTYDADTGLLHFTVDSEGGKTEYTYKENGLQWQVIQHVDDITLTTEYGYDSQSRNIWRNSEGRVTTVRYDSHNREIHTELGGVATTHQYDANGQVLRSVEGKVIAATGTSAERVLEERVTEYGYDAQQSLTHKVVKSGADWDQTQSVRSTEYRYNNTGQVAEKITGNGAVTRYTYDGRGRVVHEVNALNYVTEYQYDVNDRVTQTTRYANAITLPRKMTAFLTGKEVEKVADSSKDRVTKTQYDKDGRITYEIDGAGYATGYTYNANGQVLTATQYHKPTTEAGWNQTSTANRTTHSLYDGKGQLRFTVSPNGQVSERRYDGEGRVTQTLRYGETVSLTAELTDTAALSEHLKAQLTNDTVRSEMTVYDTLGRKRFTLDGDGYLIEYQYNRHSEVATKKEYVNNSAIKNAIISVRNGGSVLSDYAVFQQALDTLGGIEDAAEYLQERLNEVNEQQARIDSLNAEILALEQDIAATDAENHTLGIDINDAANRIDNLYLEVREEAAYQEILKQDILTLRQEIETKEDELRVQYAEELATAQSAADTASAAYEAALSHKAVTEAAVQALVGERVITELLPDMADDFASPSGVLGQSTTSDMAAQAALSLLNTAESQLVTAINAMRFEGVTDEAELASLNTQLTSLQAAVARVFQTGLAIRDDMAARYTVAYTQANRTQTQTTLADVQGRQAHMEAQITEHAFTALGEPGDVQKAPLSVSHEIADVRTDAELQAAIEQAQVEYDAALTQDARDAAAQTLTTLKNTQSTRQSEAVTTELREMLRATALELQQAAADIAVQQDLLTIDPDNSEALAQLAQLEAKETALLTTQLTLMAELDATDSVQDVVTSIAINSLDDAVRVKVDAEKDILANKAKIATLKGEVATLSEKIDEQLGELAERRSAYDAQLQAVQDADTALKNTQSTLGTQQQALDTHILNVGNAEAAVAQLSANKQSALDDQLTAQQTIQLETQKLDSANELLSIHGPVLMQEGVLDEAANAKELSEAKQELVKATNSYSLFKSQLEKYSKNSSNRNLIVKALNLYHTPVSMSFRPFRIENEVIDPSVYRGVAQLVLKAKSPSIVSMPSDFKNTFSILGQLLVSPERFGEFKAKLTVYKNALNAISNINLTEYNFDNSGTPRYFQRNYGVAGAMDHYPIYLSDVVPKANTEIASWGKSAVTNINSLLSVVVGFGEYSARKVDLEAQVARLTEVDIAYDKVREANAAKDAAETAIANANKAISDSHAALLLIDQDIADAEVALTAARSAREAGEAAVASTRATLAQAEADKANAEKLLLQARSQLNVAANNYNDAQSALLLATDALDSAYDNLGVALGLHRQADMYIRQAEVSKDEAKATLAEAQELVSLAHFSVYRKANADIASHDTSYEYDDRGQLKTELSALVSFGEHTDTGAQQYIGRLATEHTYDSLGNVRTTTTAANTNQASTKAFEYDVQGNQTRAVGLGGGSVIYNNQNLAAVNINKLGHRRYRVYDDEGRLRYEVDELGFVTEHRYDGLNQKTTQLRYTNAYTASRPEGEPLTLAALDAFISDGEGGDFRALDYRYSIRGELETTTTSSSVDSQTRTNGVHHNAFGDKMSTFTTYVDKQGESLTVTNQHHLYNAAGQLMASQDAEGYVTVYAYNGYGELSSQREIKARYVDSNDNPLVWDWTSVEVWAETQQGAARERRTDFAYDARGNRQQVTQVDVEYTQHGGTTVEQMRGDLITTTYHDHAGRQFMTVQEAAPSDPASHLIAKNRTLQSYDALGRLVSSWSKRKDYVVSGLQLSLEGVIPDRLQKHQLTSYRYDAQGNLMVTESDGRKTYQYFDADGKLTRRVDAEGNVTHVEMDAMNRTQAEWRHVSAPGYQFQQRTEYNYDATGRQTGTTVVVNGGDNIREEARYNAFGEVEAKTHNGVVQEAYVYDGLGRVHTKTLYGSQHNVITTYQYNWLDKVTVETLGGNRTTTRAYDLKGNLTGEKGPWFDGKQSVTTQTFDRWGNVLKQTMNGNTYDFVYNHANQVILQTSPLEDKTIVDANGQTDNDARPQTRMFYDQHGNRIAVQDANGHWQWSGYDLTGQKLWDKNGQGGITRYYHNIHGEMVGRINADGQGEVYRYNNNGQLLTRSKIDNTQGYLEVYAKYAYDQAGQRYHEQWFGGSGYEIYTQFDAAGRVLETKGAGQHKRYIYDSFGNKEAEIWLDGGTEQTRKTSAYDAFGKLTSDTLYDGSVVTHHYDQYGQLDKKIGAISIDYDYWKNGLLKSQTTGTKTESYQYNADGKETRRALSDGAATLVTHTEWDNLGRIERIRNEAVSAFGQSLNASTVTYRYDAVGNRRKITTTGEQSSTRWYHYDKDNRMVGSHTRANDVGTNSIGNHAGDRTISYTATGQKKEETRWENKTRDGHTALVETVDVFDYDSNGHLKWVESAEVVQGQSYVVRRMSMENHKTGHAELQRNTVYTYAYVNGQVSGNATESKTTVMDFAYQDGRLSWQEVKQNGDPTTTTYFDYHFSGQLNQQRTIDHKDSAIDTIQYKFNGRESYQKNTILANTTRRGNGNGFRAGTTSYHYNNTGQLTGITSTRDGSERKNLTDFNGQIALQLDVEKNTLLANLTTSGNPLATITKGKVDADLLDDSGSNAGQQPGTHTVGANDTLQRIAQMVYGDSRYWYLIADANGLLPTEPLTEGKLLVIPNQHTQTFNGAESFKPYNESEVLGNVNPDPIALPPPKKSCNPIAMIVMVVVAVVVTIYTAGAAATLFAGASGVAGTGVAGAATIGAAGAGVIGGATVAGSATLGIAAAAIGGAVGSAASQLVGKGLGVVDDFSWEQVAMGGLASAATAGLGAAFGTGGLFNAAPGADLSWGHVGNASFTSTTSYGANYLGSKALGEDVSFSWKNLAASVVGSVVSMGAARAAKGSIVGDTLSGFAGAASSSAIRGDSFRGNTDMLLTDAFGNALGRAVVNEIERLNVQNDSTTKPEEVVKTQPRSGNRQQPNEPTVIITPIPEPVDITEGEVDLIELERQQRPEERENKLQNHFDDKQKSGGDSLLSLYLAKFSDDKWIEDSQIWMPGYRLSTAGNPFGLSESEMKLLIEMQIKDIGKNPLLYLNQDLSKETGPMLKAQPKDWIAKRKQSSWQNSDEARWLQQRNDSFGFQVGDSLHDGLFLLGAYSAPFRMAGYGLALDTGSAIYHYREDIYNITNQSIKNGGVTLAVGLTPSYTAIHQQGAAAGGLWLSSDFSEVAVGAYLSGEVGPYVAKHNLTFDFGIEASVFASPDYKNALSGPYTSTGAGYNQNNVSYIKAANGKIQGLQYTYDFNRTSRSVYDFSRNSSGYFSFGEGWSKEIYKTGYLSVEK